MSHPYNAAVSHNKSKLKLKFAADVDESTMQDIHLKELSSNIEVLKCSSQLAEAIENMRSHIQDKTFYSTNDEIKIKKNEQREEKHKDHMNQLLKSLGYNESSEQNTIEAELDQPDQ